MSRNKQPGVKKLTDGRYQIDYRANGQRIREIIGEDYELACNILHQRKTEIWEGRLRQTKHKQPGVQEWPPDSGRYRIDYRANGRRIREMIGEDYELACNVLHQRKTEIWEGRFRPARPESITCREWAEKFQAARQGRRAKLTCYTDLSRIRTFIAKFGDEYIDKITPENIEAVFAELSAQGRAGSTINRYRVTLSALFSYAIKMKKLQINPVKAVERYDEPEGRIRFLDDDEYAALRKIIREFKPEHEAEFDLVLNTGLRRGELINLRWENISLDRKLMTVIISKTDRHYVPLNTTAIAALGDLYARSGGSPWVVSSDLRNDWGTDRRNWFEDCVKAANIEDFHFHDLRHTFASWAVMRNVRIETLREVLGHKSLKTTQKYAHLAPDFKLAEMEKLVKNDIQTALQKDTSEGHSDTSEIKLLQLTQNKIG